MSICKSKEGLGLVLLLAAGPVAAFEGGALECRFEIECYDAAGCDPTDYEASLMMRDGVPVLSDVAEEVPMQALQIDQTTAYVGHANGAVRLLTGTEGNGARLSVHQAAGDLMLNYTGICRAAE